MCRLDSMGAAPRKFFRPGPADTRVEVFDRRPKLAEASEPRNPNVNRGRLSKRNGFHYRRGATASVAPPISPVRACAASFATACSRSNICSRMHQRPGATKLTPPALSGFIGPPPQIPA